MIKAELFLDWKGRKKHDKWQPTTFICYEIEINESNNNMIELSFVNRDNSVQIVSIDKINEPLSFDKYDFLNKKYLLYSEGIIWGFQYVVNSYSNSTKKHYNIKAKVVDLKTGIIVQNEMFSYLVIDSLFKYLNYKPSLEVKRLNNIYRDYYDNDCIDEQLAVYFPEPPYPPTIGHFSKVWYKEHPEATKEIEQIQIIFYDKYCKEYDG
jgi:hypothetical protein